MTFDASELLDRFFDAIQRGDIDAITPMYSDDVQVWHNVTQRAIGKADSLDLLRYWSSKVAGVRYEILERQTYEGGAVQRHVVHGDADGSPVDAPVCITFRFADGAITHIFEYLDAKAVEAVFGPPR